VEHAEHVDLEHPAPVFGVSVGDGAVEPEPGVGDEEVHGAEALDRPGDERLAGGGVGDVGRDGECPLAELCGEVPQAVLAAGGESDVATFLRQKACRDLPDAA
jgi:hypothetical protein